MDTNKNEGKTRLNFYCELCDYYASDKFNMTRHELTNKHKILINTNKNEAKGGACQTLYICKCGKKYKHKPSLYNHYKKCPIIDDEPGKPENEKLNYNGLILMMFEQIKEQGEQHKTLQTTLIDLIPKINSTNNTKNMNTTNSNNNNTINQHVNVNVFLNENCKDAISMDEFVKSIEITVNDLLYTKNNGLANGVSNIFI